MKNDKLLSVLVIHDSDNRPETEANILGTTDLTLCSVGTNRRIVDEWRVVIDLLATPAELSPRPDMLLIDTNFEDDTSAPDLEPRIDPRGLLYGAILAAQFGAREQLPLGFAVYSMNIGSFSEDLYAQTFLGLLDGLAGRKPKSLRRGEYYKDQMDAWFVAKRGQLPRDVVNVALGRFRESLLETAGRGWSPEPTSFARARDHIQGVIHDGNSESEDAVEVQWSTGSGMRSVLLKSLFADCRKEGKWDPRALSSAEAGQYLAKLADTGSFRDNVHEVIVQHLLRYRFSDEYSRVGAGNPYGRINTKGAASHWELAVGFLVARALDLAEVDQRCRDRSTCPLVEFSVRTSTELCRELALMDMKESAVHNTMAGALSVVLLHKTKQKRKALKAKTVSEALGQSDRWPELWNADARSLTIGILKDPRINKKVPPLQYWPEWCQPIET